MATTEYGKSLGDQVVFVDEFGRPRVGRIINTDPKDVNFGCIVVRGTYGDYCLKIEDVRPAEHWEVHRAAFNNGWLD